MVDALLGASTRVSDRISEEMLGLIKRLGSEIDARLRHERDYMLHIFGFQTLARSYLLRSQDRTEESTLLDTQLMERPQHWYMRMSLSMYCGQADRQGHLAEEKIAHERLEQAFGHYDRLSRRYGSHAAPTALNSGMKNPAAFIVLPAGHR